MHPYISETNFDPYLNSFQRLLSILSKIDKLKDC